MNKLENTINWLKKYSAIIVTLIFLLLQIRTLMTNWNEMSNMTKGLEIAITVFAFFVFLFFVYYTQVRESIEHNHENTSENYEKDSYSDDDNSNQ